MNIAHTVFAQPDVLGAGRLASGENPVVHIEEALAIGIEDHIFAECSIEDVGVGADATFEVVVTAQAVQGVVARCAVQVVAYCIPVACGDIVACTSEKYHLRRLSRQPLGKQRVPGRCSLALRYCSADVAELVCLVAGNRWIDDLARGVVVHILQCQCAEECGAVIQPVVGECVRRGRHAVNLPRKIVCASCRLPNALQGCLPRSILAADPDWREFLQRDKRTEVGSGGYGHGRVGQMNINMADQGQKCRVGYRRLRCSTDNGLNRTV